MHRATEWSLTEAERPIVEELFTHYPDWLVRKIECSTTEPSAVADFHARIELDAFGNTAEEAIRNLLLKLHLSVHS